MNRQPVWSTLRFSGLVSGYHGTRVLRGISGSVAPGEVLGVIGRNGVGKSTLLRTLAGLVEPDEGTIEISNTIGAVVPLRGVPVAGGATRGSVTRHRSGSCSTTCRSRTTSRSAGKVAI